MKDHQKFLQQFRTKHFKKGEIILCQGEVPHCGYVIKTGIVKTYNLTLQGEEKPISFDTDSEVFPISWVFGKLRHAPYYHEAFTECDVYCVPRAEYMEFVESHPDYMLAMLNQFVDRCMGYQMRINALGQSKAPAKVLNMIHFLCVRFGRPVKGKTVMVQMPLTQQDLANFIGLTRETTGIELKKLQQKGVLIYKKQNYIIQTDKLNELLEEDYHLGLPNDWPVAKPL